MNTLTYPKMFGLTNVKRSVTNLKNAPKKNIVPKVLKSAGMKEASFLVLKVFAKYLIFYKRNIIII